MGIGDDMHGKSSHGINNSSFYGAFVVISGKGIGIGKPPWVKAIMVET